MTTIAGWPANKTTALDYFNGTTPADMEDAYVMKDGRLREVWDCGTELVSGHVALYGNWPETFDVSPATTIFFSPIERWTTDRANLDAGLIPLR